MTRGNLITDSGRHGIYFRAADAAMGAHCNWIEGNQIGGNCRKEGNAEVLVDSETAHAHLLRNRFTRDGDAPVAVRVAEGCRGIVAAGNESAAGFDREVDARCSTEAVSFDPPAAPPPAGPEHVPVTGTYHLALLA